MLHNPHIGGSMADSHNAGIIGDMHNPLLNGNHHLSTPSSLITPVSSSAPSLSPPRFNFNHGFCSTMSPMYTPQMSISDSYRFVLRAPLTPHISSFFSSIVRCHSRTLPSVPWPAYQPIRWVCSSSTSSTNTSSISTNNHSIIRGMMIWPRQHISVTCRDSTSPHPPCNLYTKRRTRVYQLSSLTTRTLRLLRRRTTLRWTSHPVIPFLRPRHL